MRAGKLQFNTLDLRASQQGRGAKQGRGRHASYGTPRGNPVPLRLGTQAPRHCPGFHVQNNISYQVPCLPYFVFLEAERLKEGFDYRTRRAASLIFVRHDDRL